MKLPGKCCGKCSWWAPADKRAFLGVCGHREHGGEMTDKTEGGNCADFETKIAKAWLE